MIITGQRNNTMGLKENNNNNNTFRQNTRGDQINKKC